MEVTIYRNMAMHLPQIFEFDDYHDIIHLADVLYKISPNFRCIELDKDKYSFLSLDKYQGLAYWGKKPSDKTIKAIY